MTDAEVASLGVHSWFERANFAGAAGAAHVAAAREAAGLFEPAAISRGHLRDVAVRTDSTLWVEAGDAQLEVLLAGFEALRVELNEGAWLGLTRFELQLAHYGPGGHYLRHRDALQGANNRRVTAIVYLNPLWKRSDGGQLRLFCTLDSPAHLRPAPPWVEIEPVLGRVVIFLSEKVEHEVLPTTAGRLAATAWYYGR